MNKINYFVLGIVCTVLIASMFSVASAIWPFDKLQLGPSDRTPPIVKVNAHECRADGICEVNNLTAIDNVDAKTLSSTYVNSDKGFFSANLGSPRIYIYSSSLKSYSGQISEAGNNLQIYTYDNRSLEFKSANGVVFADLAGDGNAYACLDTNGKLFRKSTPCV